MLEIRSMDDATNTTQPQSVGLHDRPTLLVSWWCTGCALVVILLRLWGRAIRSGRLFREDNVMALSIIPLLIRMACVQVIMNYGTNNLSTAGLSTEEIYERSVGSRLVLASRIFYALFIWTAKFTVSEYLKRLTTSIWTRTYELVLQGIRVFLVVTFFVVVIATLTECHPFNHYWQVVPDPGPSCRDGFAQLLAMGICDIITDILLIAFPLSIVLKSSMSLRRKISLVILFSLSLLLIVVTAYRMATIIHHHFSQQRRTLFASLEILAAAAVSNILIIGSFIRDRGVKKAKYKGYRDTSDSVLKPSISRQMTEKHWGHDSDADLFRSLGCRLNVVDEEEALEKDDHQVPSEDPTSLAQVHMDDGGRNGMASQSNNSPDDEPSRDSTMLSYAIAELPSPQERLYASRRSPNEARGRSGDPYHDSFYDVGGFLKSDPADFGLQPRPSLGRTTLVQDFAPPSNSISDPILLDPGGLLTPLTPPRQSRETTTAYSADYSLTTVRNDVQVAQETKPLDSASSPTLGLDQSADEKSLQDVGGLLAPSRNSSAISPSTAGESDAALIEPGRRHSKSESGFSPITNTKQSTVASPSDNLRVWGGRSLLSRLSSGQSSSATRSPSPNGRMRTKRASGAGELMDVGGLL